MDQRRCMDDRFGRCSTYMHGDRSRTARSRFTSVVVARFRCSELVSGAIVLELLRPGARHDDVLSQHRPGTLFRSSGDGHRRDQSAARAPTECAGEAQAAWQRGTRDLLSHGDGCARPDRTGDAVRHAGTVSVGRRLSERHHRQHVSVCAVRAVDLPLERDVGIDAADRGGYRHLLGFESHLHSLASQTHLCAA